MKTGSFLGNKAGLLPNKHSEGALLYFLPFLFCLASALLPSTETVQSMHCSELGNSGAKSATSWRAYSTQRIRNCIPSWMKRYYQSIKYKFNEPTSSFARDVYRRGKKAEKT